MPNIYKIVLKIFIIQIILTSTTYAREVDLTPHHDSNRVLVNPHKGWYHHFYANTPGQYGKIGDPFIDKVPGMKVLYLRIAWSYFEPKEGEYDWQLIDNVVDYYVPKGFKFNVCLTTKETGISYATPKWVRDAGAKGHDVVNWGLETWEPVWDDPVFLEKLENFHRAFAERYDAKSWLINIDMGTIGEWGEGHTGFSTAIPPTVKQVKAHIDMFKRVYKHTPVCINDDYHYWEKSDEDAHELLEYQEKAGFHLCEWSALVEWYVDNFPDTWGVSHPHVFERSYRQVPVWLECHHYRDVRKVNEAWDVWSVPDGQEYGADFLYNTVKTTHASWLSFQGWPEEYLNENPNFASWIINRLGYWYFPVSVELPKEITAGSAAELKIVWENRGVAPAYNRYSFLIKLENGTKSVVQRAVESDNRTWLDGKQIVEVVSIKPLQKITPGTYTVKIKLETIEPEVQPVHIALKESLLDTDGFYRIASIEIK